jgi:FAD/FMN-containing dehydrogenase
MSDMTELDTQLAGIVGPGHVLVDPERRAPYEVDWTRRHAGTARCVVRPATTAEVAGVLAACSSSATPVTLQGGNTGLVGGGVPAYGEVLLSLARLVGLGPVDEVTAHVTAGAGTTLAALQSHAGASGMAFGVDLAARDSATIGGMVATNAGGIRVVRHGPMRAQVVDVEAVTVDGAVVGGVRGLEKDNTGYHLPSLLTGSEGTLAVVTRARLRLVPRDRHRVVALVALDDVGAAVALGGLLRRSLPSLSAAELVLAEGLELVMAVAGLAAPFPSLPPAALLVECGGATDPAPHLAEVLASAEGVRGTAVAVEAADRRRLWAYRERHTEVISTLGVPHKLDVAVAPARVPELLVRARELAAAAGARLIAFGHVAEGNLHLNVLGPAPDDRRLDDAVFALVHELDGSISAEHGIGRAKAAWMARVHSPAHLAALRAVKRAFDPRGLLNPGVLISP